MMGNNGFNPTQGNVFPTQENVDPTQNVLGRFQQFKQMLTGDPRQQVQQLLSSGRVTQEQYDNAVKLANQLRQLLG